MLNKINEANSLIKALQSDIQSNEKELDKDIDLIIKEIEQMKKETKEENSRLTNKKSELERALVLKTVFSVLKTSASLLSFAGPKGKIIGSISHSAISMVSEFAIPNIESSSKISSKISNNLKDISKIIEDTETLKSLDQKEQSKSLDQIGQVKTAVEIGQSVVNEFIEREKHLNEIKEVGDAMKENSKTYQSVCNGKRDN